MTAPSSRSRAASRHDGLLHSGIGPFTSTADRYVLAKPLSRKALRAGFTPTPQRRCRQLLTRAERPDRLPIFQHTTRSSTSISRTADVRKAREPLRRELAIQQHDLSDRSYADNRTDLASTSRTRSSGTFCLVAAAAWTVDFIDDFVFSPRSRADQTDANQTFLVSYNKPPFSLVTKLHRLIISRQSIAPLNPAFRRSTCCVTSSPIPSSGSVLIRSSRHRRAWPTGAPF